jgi:long-subunit fatty acid transport protein
MKILIVSLLILIAVNLSFAQDEDQEDYLVDFTKLSPTVFDAKAHALGKCEIMGATGSSAIFSNPAHIVNLNKAQLQIGGTGWIGNFKSTDWKSEDNIYRDYSVNYKMLPSIPQFSFVKPFGEIEKGVKMSLGLGLNKYYDFSEKRVAKVHDYIHNSNSFHTTTTKGGLYFITPSVAYEFKEKINIGVAFSKSIFSQRNYQHKRTYESDYKTEVRTEGRHSIRAFFFSAGILYPLSDKLNLGFMYRSRMDIKFNKIILYKSDYRSDFSSYNSTQTLGQYYLNPPAILGFGGSIALSSTVTLYGEYQTRKWSDLEFEYDFKNEELPKIDDGRCIRVGMEEKFNNRSIRIGFFSDSVLLTDVIDLEDEILDETPLNHEGFTCGFGIRNNKLMLEMAGEYSWLKQEIAFQNHRERPDQELAKTMLDFNASLTYFLD